MLRRCLAFTVPDVGDSTDSTYSRSTYSHSACALVSSAVESQ